VEQETKNKIKETRRLTKEKHKNLQVCSYELKVDLAHCNKIQKESLKMYFIEGRQLYNYLVSLNDPFKFNTKNKTISIKKEDKLIEKELKFLPAKLRQNVHRSFIQNILNLSKKKKGNKVGKLKFKSNYNSIELDNQCFEIKCKSIRLAGIKKPFKVFGLNQIKPEYEIANAKLIKKASGYYIKVTCYKEKDKITHTGKSIGLDMGIKTTLTTSDGDKFNVVVGEPESLKRLQRKLARQKKTSNNYHKIRLKIQKNYEYIKNMKKDQANKIVHFLKTEYDFIYMQDENLKGWQKSLFGKQVQHSILGTLKSKFLLLEKTKVIPRNYASTKICYQCGTFNDIPLSARTYSCSCGLTEDRDVKASKTILFHGQEIYRVPKEFREFKPVENETSGGFIKLNTLSFCSMKQEADLVQ
jgi:putative transposase